MWVFLVISSFRVWSYYTLNMIWIMCRTWKIIKNMLWITKNPFNSKCNQSWCWRRCNLVDVAFSDNKTISIALIVKGFLYLFFMRWGYLLCELIYSLLPILTFIADVGFLNATKYSKINRTIKGIWAVSFSKI